MTAGEVPGRPRNFLTIRLTEYWNWSLREFLVWPFPGKKLFLINWLFQVAFLKAGGWTVFLPRSSPALGSQEAGRAGFSSSTPYPDWSAEGPPDLYPCQRVPQNYLEFKISVRQQNQELIFQQPHMMQGSIRKTARNAKYQNPSFQAPCANQKWPGHTI